MTILLWIIGILLAIILVGILLFFVKSLQTANTVKTLTETLSPKASILEVEGMQFRDLNNNGVLDPYEDHRLPVEERVEDLLSQMTLEEKAGLMFHSTIGTTKDGSLADKLSPMNQTASTELIVGRHITHFNILGLPPIRFATEWMNTVQELAERTRLGIPVTISTDPRHAFTNNPATSMLSGDFSRWPEQPGFAAINDASVAREFGDIARQEYLAVGIRVALHPMADLATEPRWGRSNGTFGEDADTASELIKMYILGFQGEELGSHSVACMTKHFPGAGPQADGEDAHFAIGKDQIYPGDNFDYHLKPFEAAFEANSSQIMPYYGRPMGTDYEEVGFGFNKGIITDLLRGKYDFDGIVCSDWMLLNGMKILGYEAIPAKEWGVEHLSVPEKALKMIDAGIDQFGGEKCPEVVVELVKTRKITEERINQSVRRILREKFVLGLFDNPYVDPDEAVKTVGQDAFRQAGKLAQKKSYVLLKNGKEDNAPVLPLSGKPRLYVEGIAEDVASQYGTVVKTPAEADFAILRLGTPYEKRWGLLESIFHQGDLDFKGKEKQDILDIIDTVPTIVDIYLERPAVIPEISDRVAALLANFGSEEDVALDIIFGNHAPTGKLPFELPSSMEAVRNQKEDVPYDSENPLYEFGFGLTYS